MVYDMQTDIDYAFKVEIMDLFRVYESVLAVYHYVKLTGHVSQMLKVSTVFV